MSKSFTYLKDLKKMTFGGIMLAMVPQAAVGFEGDNHDFESLANVTVSKSGLFNKAPLEAYRQGIAAFRQGWYDLALQPIKYAADRGIIGAQLTLARMYAEGLNVRQSDAKAFLLYQQVYQDYREGGTSVRRGSPAEKHIAQAYIELAKYYLTGLKQSHLPPDFNKALELLEAASINFSAPEAQYMLAKMYISGKGVEKNVKRAIRWLNNASRDHDHAPSQALLAEILWQGNLVPKQVVRALALITLARDNATPNDAGWITAIYDTIINESDAKQKLRAANAVAGWVKQRKENRLRIERVMQRQRDLIRRNRGSNGIDHYNIDFLKPKTFNHAGDYYTNIVTQKRQLRGSVDGAVPVTGSTTMTANGLLAMPAKSKLRNIDTPFAYGIE